MVVALLGGLGAWWLTSPPPEAAPPPRLADKRPVKAAAPRPDAPAVRTTPDPDVVDEPGGRPVPALVPQGIQPGDDPDFRARLESQAKVAAPYWAKVAPKVSDPALRTRATEMFTRLQTLGEPAEALAKEQYTLTQELITAGGLDHKSQVYVDYLNSTSAMVLQGGGDPADIPDPDQAMQKVERRR